MVSNRNIKIWNKIHNYDQLMKVIINKQTNKQIVFNIIIELN